MCIKILELRRSTDGKWTIVPLDEVDSLDVTTLVGSNSLYWSVMLNDKNVISDWINYLSNRGLLSNEVYRTHPNATIFHLLLSRSEEDPYGLLVHLLQENVVRKYTLLTEFKGRHVIHLMMEHKSERIRSLVSTSKFLYDTFNQAAFDSEKDREKQIERYQMWRNTHVHFSEKYFTDKIVPKIRGVIIRHSHLLLYEMKTFVKSRLTGGVSFPKFSPMLLSDNEVSEAFFKNCLGIESGECEDEQIVKYKEWREFPRKDLASHYKDLLMIITLNLLKRRPFILKYEVNVMLKEIKLRSDLKEVLGWELGRLRLVLIENDQVCDTEV